MKSILTLICLLLLAPLSGAQTAAPAPPKAAPVTLAWDYGEVPGVTFRLFSKGVDGSWAKVADIQQGREYALPALTPGLHTFVVRAVLAGVESPNSNELPVLAPPGGLRWSITITSP